MRLLGGFRLNLSRGGFGYSWGVRGFRIGRDSRGRLVRTVSIPGTGLYNRQYLSGGTAPQQNSGQQSSGMGCGGCITTVSLVLIVLLIFERVAESGSTVGLILFVIALLGVYVIWQFRNKPNVRQAEVTPQNYEWLGQEVKTLSVVLEAPIKTELRKYCKATDYETLFEGEFTVLICRFAALDGAITPSEAKVFLDIFTVLHPKQYAGFLAEDGATLLEGHRQRNPETFLVPIQKSMLFTLTQQAGEPFANKLKELMYKVALQVALADGPLSPMEQSELEALQSALEARTQQLDGNRVPMPNADPATVTPGLIDPVATAGADMQVQRPITDPQFTLATGLVTIEILKEKTKELVELLEPLLKVELRQVRQSSNARIVLEQDIRAIIIRLGLSNGSISEYAAHLYLEIFKVLHPKTFAAWKVHDALDVLQNILEKSRDTYTGSPKKPFTLEVVERLDAAHGTGITKPTRDLFLIIAVFAASVGGKVSDEKQTEIAQLKATLEAHE